MTDDTKISSILLSQSIYDQPCDITLDLDHWPCGRGIREIKVNIHGKEFVFTKTQLLKFIQSIHAVSK
jgi:hypothetical protein